MESGDEDEAFNMGEREWQKMNRDLTNQGYRDGIEEGRDKSRQRTFEKATAFALKHSISLGQLLGSIEWKLTQPLSIGHKRQLGSLRENVLMQLNALKLNTQQEHSDVTTMTDKIAEFKNQYQIILKEETLPSDERNLLISTYK